MTTAVQSSELVFEFASNGMDEINQVHYNQVCIYSPQLTQKPPDIMIPEIVIRHANLWFLCFQLLYLFLQIHRPSKKKRIGCFEGREEVWVFDGGREKRGGWKVENEESEERVRRWMCGLLAGFGWKD